MQIRGLFINLLTMIRNNDYVLFISPLSFLWLDERSRIPYLCSVRYSLGNFMKSYFSLFFFVYGGI
jgi:hypothetical protein